MAEPTMPINLITGNKFFKARELMLPVTIINERTYRIPSATREEREHLVTFDSADYPTQVGCTCEAGQFQTACWAMARAFDALTLLCVNRLYIASKEDAERVALAATTPDIPPALTASIGHDGEMKLLLKTESPATISCT